MISSDERAAAHRAGHSTPELRRMRLQQQETAAALPQPVISPDPDPVAVGEFTLTPGAATLRNPGDGFTSVLTDGSYYLLLYFDNPDQLTTQELRLVIACDNPTLVREAAVFGSGDVTYYNFVSLSLSRGNWSNELTVQVYVLGG